MNNNNESYTDDKGRTRWRVNDEISDRLLELHTFLIISDYPEDHAARYPRLAHSISRFPKSVADLVDQGRLQEEIGGVGEIVSTIITEYLQTGTCSKIKDYAGDIPQTVAELVLVPGLGAKTIKRLYEEIEIDSLASLRTAIDEGKLKGFKGIGKKTLDKIEEHLDANL